MSNSELDKHNGHRARLRRRFEKAGLDGFNDYEVLELLLTYTIPRKDTKDISKNLLKKFSSLKEILSADTKELEQINGLGRQSVIFIKALNEFIRYYFEHQVEKDEMQLTTPEQTAEYLKGVIGNFKYEVVKALFLNSQNKLIHTDLNSQNKLIHTELISEGTVNESYLSSRKIVETALRYNATSVIVAHNHPDGIPEPSEDDNFITQKIAGALKIVDVDLQDHIIIGSNDFYSYRQKGIL